jgi:hypothetical protein
MEARLPDRVPLSEVIDKDPAPVEAKVDSGPSSPDVFSDTQANPDYRKLADFMDLTVGERRDHSVAEKLSFLYNWGMDQEGVIEGIDALLAVKGLVRGLGYREKGLGLVNKLYKYARLSNESKRLSKEMELLSA